MITKFDATWVGSGYDYPLRWHLKKDLPPMNPGCVSIRVAFRFEVAYIIIDENKRAKMTNGWMPLWDFHFPAFGRVVGPQDFMAAEHTPMAEEWRISAQERRSDQITQQPI